MPDQTNYGECGQPLRRDGRGCSVHVDKWTCANVGAMNERVRMAAVRGEPMTVAYWACLGYGASVAHKFVKREPTGSNDGTRCGLWTAHGGTPAGTARRCARCVR